MYQWAILLSSIHVNCQCDYGQHLLWPLWNNAWEFLAERCFISLYKLVVRCAQIDIREKFGIFRYFRCVFLSMNARCDGKWQKVANLHNPWIALNFVSVGSEFFWELFQVCEKPWRRVELLKQQCPICLILLQHITHDRFNLFENEWYRLYNPCHFHSSQLKCCKLD